MSGRRSGSRGGGGRQPDGGAGSYRHPVPEPNALVELLTGKGLPMTLEQIARELGIQGERPRAALRTRLDDLVRAGRLLRNRRQEYCLLDRLDAVPGTVSSHRDGFGFLLPDDGSDDVYLSAVEMRSLMDGDRVAVRVAPGGRAGRRAGSVVEILARGRESLVGRYHREHGIGFVVEAARSPHHFIVPDRYRNGAEPGQLVKLEIMEYPGPLREAQGRIAAVLGDPGDPRVLTDAAIAMFDLPGEWPPGLETRAGAFGTHVRPADHAGRTDLREMPLVTIDGADARDFDDAVYAEPRGDGWRLVVAIADVSHYVQPGDELDREARRRGTSVYFPDRVVPMLPESLSNGLCSLNPAVDRLCMVCDMVLDEAGKVSSARFYRAIMHSRARLTYDEVDAAEQGRAHTQATRRVAVQLEHLYGAYRCLAAARARRGALELDLPETKILLGPEGTVQAIVGRQRNDAHRLIEECMITANVEAGRFIRRHRLPTLYRVHDGPEETKFEELRLLLQGLGLSLPDVARRRAREVDQALRALRHRPDFPMLATAVLRSMPQAVYQPENIGHYGLALQCYTHFTSPIRRYPDLLVHRAIGHVLDRQRPGDFPHDNAAMDQLGKITSRLERRADEATRHVEARCKCLFMEKRVGEELDGVVTGIAHFGLFVTLRDIYVDGLIHVTSLPSDYYHLGQGGLSLTGERSGEAFTLGQDLRVRIARVDPEQARIDLVLADSRPGSTGPRPSPGRDRPGAARTGRRPAGKPGPRRGRGR